MKSEEYSTEIVELQSILNNLASDKKKIWWEKYMKNVIDFRGVGIPDIRKAQINWVQKYLVHLSYEEQIDIAMQCLKQKFAEDKLAGILLFENYLYDKKPLSFMLKQYTILFKEELIYDWNICDWFCVRVLKNTIIQHGFEAANEITKWKDSKNVWQARCSVVSFVGLAKDDQYIELILESCKVLIQREERFAKTAVGWILHDMYKDHKKIFFDFIEKFLFHFSVESLKNSIKHLETEIKKQYLERFKSIKKAT